MIKVASYCRVSTDRDDQANSFASQQRFFRAYIEQRPDWELYDIYADEGTTGTSTRKRIQFNRMMNDAYHRKFELIITKEVSRFSRNILDTITYTRELKALGIGVIFMSDGFCSLDPDAELRLSIMGSIAQEESRKISSRVKWGQTRQMERGVVFGKSMLGYDVKNGKLFVNPENAEIVKQIFYKYGVEKKGTTVIARELREAGHKTYTGNPIWSSSHILKILKNEKYIGNLIQKKTITPDYLTHTKKYNHGEETLVIQTGHHEPIISQELWDLVQNEISKRHRTKQSSNEHSHRYLFSGKIICGECGARFISRTKTRKDGSSYKRWGCYTASRYGRRKTDSQGNFLGCDIAKQIRDDLAVEMLKYIMQNLDINYNRILQNLTLLAVNAIRCESISNNSPAHLQLKIEVTHKKWAAAIDSFLSGLITEEDFLLIKSRYTTELASLENRLTKINDNPKPSYEQRTQQLRDTLDAMITCKSISDSYLRALLDYMRVHKDGTVEIKLNQLSSIWKFQLCKE